MPSLSFSGASCDFTFCLLSKGKKSYRSPTMADSNSQDLKASKSHRHWIIENVVSLVVALLIVFMIRSSIIEAFKIPSGSMIPTLLIGDHIFVNKFAYGLKIPFSDLVTDHPVYLVKRDPPKRGDVVVFMFPKDESIYFIKRVVGLPGDTIEMRNKVLYINQQMVARDPVGGEAAQKVFAPVDDPKYTSTNLDLFTEHLDKADHFILIDKTNFMGESYPPTVVPPESLFVMGDNRDFSNDSRFWGFVPLKNVKGKAIVIWLSLWLNFSDGQFLFRPTRIGTPIH
jgi:signal peptidase I